MTELKEDRKVLSSLWLAEEKRKKEKIMASYKEENSQEEK